VNPGPTEAEALQYLADLGWSDLYGAPQTPAPAPSGSGESHSPILFAAREPTKGPADLEALALAASTCRRCGLCETRSRAVFASGDPRARLMLVGEAPGAEEDRQGLPFVGPAGELLNKILEAIGLRRDEVYVANVVKCRPPGNREPQPDEVAACRYYLDSQIDLVRPALLVALGRVAGQSLLGRDSSLARMRGDWHEVRGIPLRVTYHPAALLRNAAYKRPTWEDMQLVRDRLRSSPGGSSGPDGQGEER